MEILRRKCRWVLVLTNLILGICFLTPDDAAAVSEYDLKAVFLLNFAKFVGWPSSSFSDKNSPIVIGVLGNDPFGSTLDNTVRNEKAKGRKVVVKRSKQLSDLKGSHILFVSSSEKGRLSSIFQEAHEWHALTVGDTSGFAEKGGIINLVMRGNKVNLEVNTAAASKAGLTISSQLLKLAKIIS